MYWVYHVVLSENIVPQNLTLRKLNLQIELTSYVELGGVFAPFLNKRTSRCLAKWIPETKGWATQALLVAAKIH